MKLFKFIRKQEDETENVMLQKEEAYVDWLENMVVMLSKNYLELIHASSEETLKSVNLPHSNDIRASMMKIAENTNVMHGVTLEQDTIQNFTMHLINNQNIKKYARKRNVEVTICNLQN